MATSYSEGVHPSDWLKGEQETPPYFSREEITILAGSSADRALTSGMVLGKITKGAASAGAVVGTGNGAISAVTVGAGAIPGIYTVRFIIADTDLGDFIVLDPNGNVVGYGRVGVAFSQGGLGFTISDGSSDFVVGDTIAITVAAGSGKVVQYDQDGTTGEEDAYGILFEDKTAPDGVDVKAVAIVRNAVFDPTKITWPADIDAGEKTAALAQLAAKGILPLKGE